MAVRVAFMLKLLGKVDVTKEFLVRQLIKGWNKIKIARDTRRLVYFLLMQRQSTALGSICFDG